MFLAMAKPPKIIDAKFEVINGPTRPKPKPWFDWQNFLIVSAVGLMVLARRLLSP